MSKKSAGAKARDRVPPRGAGSPAPDAPPVREPAVSLPPLKPRPRLFYGLLTAFALWVGVLLGLYFFTVYPTRVESASPPADTPTEGSVSR
jgi:hypothetical protein